MHAQSKFYILPHGNGFSGLEIHTCYDIPLLGSGRLDNGDTLFEGCFFTIYGCEIGAGLVEVGDFTTFEEACDVAEKLGGVA